MKRSNIRFDIDSGCKRLFVVRVVFNLDRKCFFYYIDDQELNLDEPDLKGDESCKWIRGKKASISTEKTTKR